MNKREKYYNFTDDEEFVPDQGRNQILGEVFTPKFVVDKMLRISNIYNSDFCSTIFEPAAGTGNFIAEILCDKLSKVIKEIEKEITNKKQEYEIKSLLSLASITFNDIDFSNIERIKLRLGRIMEKYYINFFLSRNKDNINIPNYYLKAISDILSANAILANFIGKKNKKILFIRYFRYSKTRILRCVYNFDQLLDNNLFSNTPIYQDVIKFNEWILEVQGHNIEYENSDRK